MLQVKRIICITLVLSAFMFPTAAFASSGQNSSNNNQILNQILSYFSSHKNDKTNDNDWERQKEQEFNDWYSKNKQYSPPEESYDIWKKWFCN